MNVGQYASEAVKAYLAGLSPALETVTDFYCESEDPDSPENEHEANVRNMSYVHAFFSDAQEFPMRTGNYSGVLNIKIAVSADDEDSEGTNPVARLNATFEEVWSKISTDTFIADLNAAAAAQSPAIPFTAFGYTEGLSQSDQVIEGRHRTKTIGVPINCCAAAIA